MTKISQYFFSVLIGLMFVQPENLFAQDSSQVKWRISYSASVSFFSYNSFNRNPIAPISLQAEFFIDKISIYAGPKLFDEENNESSYYPEPQPFKHRIGLVLGTEYFIFSFRKKADLFLFYNFQYHYEIGHGPYLDLAKSDDYYYEHTGGVGACFNISQKINISLHYSLGNLRIKRYLTGDIYFNDYFDHILALSIGYNFIKQ